nr:MAG TPA: Protein of unknown function (DUF1027) [Caudoviricetes sp.]
MPISEEFPLMEYCNMGGNIFQVKNWRCSV